MVLRTIFVAAFCLLSSWSPLVAQDCVDYSRQPRHVKTLRADLWPEMSGAPNFVDLVHEGGLVCAASSSRGLVVLDLADVLNPLPISVTPLEFSADRLCQSGAFAFLQGGEDLRIINLEDPAEPVAMGGLQLPVSGRGIALVGDFLFVFGTSGQLMRVDVSDPEEPVLLPTLALSPIIQISTAGDRLALMDIEGFWLFEVDAQGDLDVASHLTGPTPWIWNDFAVTGDMVAFGCDSPQVQLADFSDPSSPSVVGQYENSGWFGARIALWLEDALIMATEDNLVILDSADPTNPRFLGAVQHGDPYGLVLAKDDHLMAVGHDGQIDVFEVTLPESVLPLAVVPVETGGELNSLHDFPPSGNVLLAGSSEGLLTIDVSDPLAPRVAHVLEVEGGLGGLALKDSHVYAAAGFRGLYVLDCVDPFDPAIVSRIPLARTSRVFVDGCVLAVDHYAQNEGGITFLDITDPANPAIRGTYSFANPGWWEPVWFILNDGYAYWSTLLGGSLGVVDYSDPDAPEDLGQFGDFQNFWHEPVFALQGSTLFFGGWPLAAFDVADPALPIPLEMETLITFKELLAAGHHLYGLPVGGGGLQVVDAGSPTELGLTGQAYDGAFLESIARKGDHLYLAGPDRISVYVPQCGDTSTVELGNGPEDRGIQPVPVALRVAPNPFNPVTMISFSAPPGNQVRIDVLDIGGRRVRTLFNGVMLDHLQQVSWDGRDRQGRQVASGVYFVRLGGEGIRESRKVVLMK